MKATIKNIPEFITLLHEHNLSPDKIRTILEKGFKIYADEKLNTYELKEQLKKYWDKYAFSNERPFMLDDSIDVEEYLKGQTNNDRPGFLTEYKTLRAAKIASLHYKTGMHNNDILLLGDVVCTFK
jgi:hypothetical protein